MVSANFQIVKVNAFSDIPSGFPSHICHYVESTDKYYIWRNNTTEEIFVDYSTLVNSSVINKTYSELAALRNNNDLIPGASYRITDFQTIYNQPHYGLNFSSVYAIVKTSAVDPLIVVAISENAFSEEAYQESSPKDKLKYIFDYTTPVTNTTTKGKITQRIDEWNNETDYDHKTVLFKRYFKPRLNNSYPLYYVSCFSLFGENPLLAYDITTDTPSLSNNTNPTYKAYYCTTSGSRLFNSTTITVNIGNWVVYDGSNWSVKEDSMEFLTFVGIPSMPVDNKINVNKFKYDTQYLGDNSFFDLPNIVIFGGNEDVSSNIIGFAKNVTINTTDDYNRTFVNNKFDILLDSQIIGNTIDNKIGRTENVDFFGYMAGNDIKSFVSSKINGNLTNNIGNELSFIYSLKENSTISIAGNNFIKISEFDFLGINAIIQRCQLGVIIFDSTINSPTIDKLNYFSFTDNNINILTNCKFNFLNSVDKLFSMQNCNINNLDDVEFTEYFDCITAKEIWGSKFYGATRNCNFIDRVINCTFGPNFGYIDNNANLLSFDSKENISSSGNQFNSTIENCNFGANVVNNIFNCYMKYIDITDGFKNNIVNFLPNGNYADQQIIFQPELIDLLKVEINSKKLSAINDANILSYYKFTTLDANGDTIYWMSDYSFNSDTLMPYSNVSPFTFIGATETALGTGKNNTIKVAKFDNYNLKDSVCSIALRDNAYVPTTLELIAIRNWYIAHPAITMPTQTYWTSTEVDANNAYAFDFVTGNITSNLKSTLFEKFVIIPHTHINIASLNYTDEFGALIVKDLI
jgi:hypothetical protein